MRLTEHDFQPQSPRLFSAILSVTLLAVMWTASTSNAQQASWPEFRGPTGQGVSTATQLPVKLDVSKAVWSCALPGSGWSSPVVSNGRAFMTTAIKQGENHELFVLGVDVAKGRVVFQTKLFEHGKVRIHSKNSHASATPIVRDEKVFVHFGPHGTAAVDTDGNVLWKNDQLDYPPVHGNGGSPILVDDLLIFSADGGKEPFIAALNTEDGSVVWRTIRPTTAKKKFSFTTPLAVTVGGATQIVSPGSDRLSGLDSQTGKELWHATYTGYSVIPRPVEGQGMVYFSTSYDSPTVLAVKLGGVGDVTDSHVAWTLKRGAPHTPSMILSGEELFMVSDKGVAVCVNATTGEEYWRERIDGNYSASPILAAGKIYFLSEDGVCTVVAAKQKFQVLGTSSLGQRTLASPAVIDNALIIRTDSNLYRFE